MKKYIDIAKSRQNVSQNGLAKMLGITGGALSQIANGGSISDEVIVKLARLSGVKPEKILVEYELSKDHSPQVRSMWERIGGHAAVWAMLAVLLTFGAVNPSKVEANQAFELGDSRYYVK